MDLSKYVVMKNYCGACRHNDICKFKDEKEEIEKIIVDSSRGFNNPICLDLDCCSFERVKQGIR